ncbi:MAG: hypothetical protein WCP28_13470 [Actinomycetes bacterium]
MTTSAGAPRDAAARGIAAVLAEVPGCWVAIDRRTHEARAVADSPYELAAQIRNQDLHNIAVVRAPDPSEPELVGLG